MTVYLIHLWRELAPGKHTARHYLGSTSNLTKRIKAHRKGQGARFLEVAKERGILFSVVRTWPRGRNIERQLKRLKNAPRLCPICSGIEGDTNFYS